MAAPLRSATRTESTCTMETARGTHAFRIVGYSLLRGIGRGKFVRSANFAVGGYYWAIRFYPDGEDPEVDEGYVSVYLELRSKGTEVRALYDFRLVDPTTGRSSSVYSQKTAQFFRSQAPDVPAGGGTGRFMKRSKLEASRFLRMTALTPGGGNCDEEPRGRSSGATIPDLLDHLEKLLGPEDVTFKVKGEVFHAHKVMLALRSPVFKAELYGPMRAKKRWRIEVEDVEPHVFRALRHFIYTDSLPAMDDLSGDESEEMVRHVLVAADRYGMERMKLVCERILCKRIGVESVATTLALADQYRCSKLRDACIGFINSSNKKGTRTSKGPCWWTYLRKQPSLVKSRMCILS
ncbi:hypothetical protein C2845_PM13G07020 [Panicum miliaceum]|uniref:BTB/POZ and MATH domain-containing protein 2-like n=1 Tax=Panicum miliaceum TaxID=4540 RepID=A0A3L6RLV4_PANMI|nr:hypothetical protein C2845_PM13G07020 [Panicum miliaceum]